MVPGCLSQFWALCPAHSPLPVCPQPHRCPICPRSPASATPAVSPVRGPPGPGWGTWDSSRLGQSRRRGGLETEPVRAVGSLSQAPDSPLSTRKRFPCQGGGSQGGSWLPPQGWAAPAVPRVPRPRLLAEDCAPLSPQPCLSLATWPSHSLAFPLPRQLLFRWAAGASDSLARDSSSSARPALDATSPA